MENYISKQTSYELAHEIATKAKKVLGLSEYDQETLEHDINNLRAYEWIDLFNMIPDSNEVKKLYFTHCVELENENEQELGEDMEDKELVEATGYDYFGNPIEVKDWAKDYVVKKKIVWEDASDNDETFDIDEMKTTSLYNEPTDSIIIPVGTKLEYQGLDKNGQTGVAVYSLPQYNNVEIRIYFDYWRYEFSEYVSSPMSDEEKRQRADAAARNKAERELKDSRAMWCIASDSYTNYGYRINNGSMWSHQGKDYLYVRGVNKTSGALKTKITSNNTNFKFRVAFKDLTKAEAYCKQLGDKYHVERIQDRLLTQYTWVEAKDESGNDIYVTQEAKSYYDTIASKTTPEHKKLGSMNDLDDSTKKELEQAVIKETKDFSEENNYIFSLYVNGKYTNYKLDLDAPKKSYIRKFLQQNGYETWTEDGYVCYRKIASNDTVTERYAYYEDEEDLDEEQFNEKLKEDMSGKKLMLVWNHFDPSDINLIYDNDFSRLESYMSTEDDVIYEDEGAVESGIFLLAHNDESEMLSFVGHSIEDVKTKFIQAVEEAKAEAQEYEDEDLNLGDPFYYCTDNLNLSSEEMFNEWINWITSSQVDGDSGYAWHLIDVANKQVLYGSQESEVIFYDSVDEYFNDLTGGLDNTEGEELEENTITSTLPPVIDQFLMDCAQMYCNFDYTDISNFGERATEDEIKLLRKIRTDLKDGFDEDDPEVSDIFNEIEKIVKGTGLTEATGQRGRYEVEVFDEGDWHKLNSWSTIDKAVEAGEAAVEAVYQDYRVIDKESGEPVELTEDYEGIDITESVLAGAILTGLGTSIGAGLISAVQRLFKKDPSKKKSKWIDYKGYLIEKTPEGEIKLFDAQSKQIGKGIEFHTMKQAQKYIKDLKKGKITDEEPFPEFEAQQDSSSEVNESVLMEKDPNLTDSQKKYVEDMYNKDMEFYGFASYDSEDDFVEDVTIDFDELEAIEMYKYYKQLHEVNGTDESLNGDLVEETELDESSNSNIISDLAKELRVNGPRSRQDRKPEPVPGCINEINIPDEMRYKEYDFREENGALYIKWITQGSFTSEDVDIFIDEVASAIDDVAKDLGIFDKFDVIIEVTSRDGKESGYAKETLRFEHVESDSEQIEEAKSNNSLSARLKARLNKLTECNSEDQLTEEKLSTRLIRRLNQGKINEASIVEEVTDVDLTEESLKWNIGSDKLVSTDSEEFAKLVDLAKLLQEKSPNGFMYTVEKTYEDFGAGMQWYNIICHNKKGDRWQVLNTKQWLELANGKLTVEQSYDSIIKDEYFQDKISGDVNTMNHSQLLKFMDSFDEE